jgi:hypothetical protein
MHASSFQSEIREGPEGVPAESQAANATTPNRGQKNLPANEVTLVVSQCKYHDVLTRCEGVSLHTILWD